MKNEFSAMLTGLREKAGYPTAYKFYHDRGGKGVLRMSYRSYLMVEQGRSLPVLDRLRAFIWALRLTFRSPEANALVAAWLKASAGEEAFNELISPMLSPLSSRSELSPMDRVVNNSVDRITTVLSSEQVEAITRDLNNYRCYLTFVNDDSSWTAERMASLLNIGRREVEKAMLSLAEVKLCKKLKDGSFRGPELGKMRAYPPRDQLPDALLEKMSQHRSALLANGRPTYALNMLFRADEKELANYYPILDVAMKASASFCTNRKTPASAMFIVRARVNRLWDF